MPKRVLDVGNCGVDHGAIRSLLTSAFAAEVLQAHGSGDALEMLARGPFDLVLVNRKLDSDYSDGLEVIRQIKADPRVAAVPCMLITNYPDHQEEAVAAGAEYGFGKKELNTPQTHARLARLLGTSRL